MKDSKQKQEEEKDHKIINLNKEEKIKSNRYRYIKKRLNTSPYMMNNIQTETENNKYMENFQTNPEMENNQRDDEERVYNFGLDEPKEEILQLNYLTSNTFKEETYEPTKNRDNKTEDKKQKKPTDSLNPKCWGIST